MPPGTSRPRLGGLIDAILRRILNFLRARFYSWRGPAYGLREAVFWPKLIDYWIRNAEALAFILREAPEGEVVVLDIGSGGGGLAEIIERSRDRHRIRLIVADYDKAKVAAVAPKPFMAGRLVTDAANLPLRTGAVDFVSSIDLLEHLPPDRRSEFLREARRVARKASIHHCPMDDGEGMFRAEEGDRRFQDAHVRRFQRREAFTDEPLGCAYPDPDEVRSILPGATIRGDQNAGVWLKYMMFYRRPVAGYLAGFAYLLRWRRRNGRPPFYSAFITAGGEGKPR